MEEPPGDAAEGPGMEFGSRQQDVIRVPADLAMEVISFGMFTGRHVPVCSL